jgi:hypothetical protein
MQKLADFFDSGGSTRLRIPDTFVNRREGFLVFIDWEDRHFQVEFLCLSHASTIVRIGARAQRLEVFRWTSTLGGPPRYRRDTRGQPRVAVLRKSHLKQPAPFPGGQVQSFCFGSH